MQTVVTERGQTSIPAEIRKHLGIKAGQKLQWIEDGKLVHVMPVPDDPIEALCGITQGRGMLKALLEERRKERAREDSRRG